MTQPGGGSVNEPDRNVDVYLGDADAVDKTTFASDVHGADPGAAPDQKRPVEAAVRPGNGLGPVGWVALVLALLALLAYGAGLFT